MLFVLGTLILSYWPKAERLASDKKQGLYQITYLLTYNNTCTCKYSLCYIESILLYLFTHLIVYYCWQDDQRVCLKYGLGRTFILYLIIVGRSRERPHAMTRTPLGKPMGRSISGRNMPLLPSSVHFPSSGWNPKISILGSVYGL